EGGVNRGAVERDELHAPARRQVVERLRDELLPRAALADDQDRKGRGCDLFDLAVDVPDRLRAATPACGGAALSQLGPQAAVLREQLPRTRHLFEEDLQLRRLDRLLEEVLR